MEELSLIHQTKGNQWELGAVGCGRWTGVQIKRCFRVLWY